jgi:hypothetical protein
MDDNEAIVERAFEEAELQDALNSRVYQRVRGSL